MVRVGAGGLGKAVRVRVKGVLGKAVRVRVKG